MKLVELQKLFQSCLTNSGEISEHPFASPVRGDWAERLAIYQDAYYLRLIGALKLEYSVLQNYLGFARFNKLMLEYLQHHPSQFFSIKSVGALLPSFIAKHYPKEVIWQEITNFEQKLEEALYAPEAKAFTLDELQKLSAAEWPCLIFSLHPSVRFQQCSYNIPESWALLREGVVDLTCYAKAATYLIWQKEFEAYFSVVSEQDEKFLNLIQEGKDFAEICESIAETVSEEEAVLIINQLLQRWLKEGVLVRTS